MIVAVLLAALVQVVHFPGGSARITNEGAAQHVVILDAHGAAQSDSYCDAQSGRYDEIVRLGEVVKAAAAHGDRETLLGVVEYPLRVNGRKTTWFHNAAELRKSFAVVFPAGLLARLAQLEPHDVFCRNGMSTIGGGLLWATTAPVLWQTAAPHQELRVAVINE